MKTLLTFFILMTSAHAVTIAKYRSTTEGSSSLKFVLAENETKKEKTSNFFDPNPNDYGVGVYKLQTVPAELASTKKKLEELAAKLKVVDDYLKTKNSSFNAVSGPVEHEAIIIVDDFRIRPDSKYYAELDGLFKKLQAMDWKMDKGFRVSKDLEKVMEIENGKTVKEQKYARDVYCSKASPPTTCTYYGGGKIYVK